MRVQRFECLHCHRLFCQRSFATTYWLKRPELLPQIAELAVGGMANRQIARALRCAPSTVDLQLSRLGRHGLLSQRQVPLPASTGRDIVIDGLASFEHSQFYPFEILAHRSYSDLDYSVGFWRTKSGLEVDFVLGDGEVAVEVKGSDRIGVRDLRPLRTFVEEYGPRQAFLVCNEAARRVVDGVLVVPWWEFLELLRVGEVLGRGMGPGCRPSRPARSASQTSSPVFRRPASGGWAMLLARIYEDRPLQCPRSGAIWP